MNAPDTLDRVETLASDDMLYYFTSGTTGEPKAVIHDFSYPIAHIMTAKNWHGVVDGGLHFTVADSGWAKSAWGKLYGQWFCQCGIMVYDYDNFYANELLQILEEERVKSFCAPPTIYKYLVREDILMKHPAVFECAVTGYPSATRDSIVKASIILNQGFTPDSHLKTELQDFVKANTAVYKYPRRIEFVEDLPRTVTGKISRKKIREMDEKK